MITDRHHKLLGLYIDQLCSEADLTELHAELQTNPELRTALARQLYHERTIRQSLFANQQTQPSAEEAGQLIGAYMDGVASNAEAARLAYTCTEQPEVAHKLAQQCYHERSIKQYFLASQQINGDATDRQQTAFPKPKHFLKQTLTSASIAAAAVMIALFFTHTTKPTPPPEVAQLQQDSPVTTSALHVIRELNSTSQSVPLVAGTQLHFGDRLVLTEQQKAELAFTDGTVFTLTGPADFSYTGSSSGKYCTLVDGLLHVDAAPQIHHPLRIQSPHALTTVRGTIFDLDVSAAETYLAMSEGRVDFASGNHSAIIVADTEHAYATYTDAPLLLTERILASGTFTLPVFSLDEQWGIQFRTAALNSTRTGPVELHLSFTEHALDDAIIIPLSAEDMAAAQTSGGEQLAYIVRDSFKRRQGQLDADALYLALGGTECSYSFVAPAQSKAQYSIEAVNCVATAPIHRVAETIDGVVAGIRIASGTLTIPAQAQKSAKNLFLECDGTFTTGGDFVLVLHCEQDGQTVVLHKYICFPQDILDKATSKSSSLAWPLQNDFLKHQLSSNTLTDCSWSLIIPDGSSCEVNVDRIHLLSR